MKKILLTIILIFSSYITFAQIERPIKWSYKAERINKSEAVVYFKAKLEGSWHLYAQSVPSNAMRLKFSFLPSRDFLPIGKTTEPKPVKKFDKNLKIELAYFEKEVVFRQKIRLSKSSTVVKGKIEFMICNDKSCLPADEIKFSIPVN